MEKKSIKTMIVVVLFVFVLHTVAIIVPLLIANFSSNVYVQITAIICSSVLYAVIIVCTTVCIIKSMDDSDRECIDTEKRELLAEIKGAFSGKPKYIYCSCKKRRK